MSNDSLKKLTQDLDLMEITANANKTNQNIITFFYDPSQW